MNSKNLRMPETLSVVEHAENLRKQGLLPARPTTKELRERVLAEKINFAGPTNAALDMKQGSDFNGAFMTLPVMSIKLYDKNPRQSINPKYYEIKEGIRLRGKYTEVVSVTKRPGESNYMLYAGANTRLMVLQELWNETQNPTFEYIDVKYVEWISEADTLSAHLIENEARADTTFWEKAKGLISLKDEMEAESGEIMTSRALEEHVRKIGMSIGTTMIQNYLFTVEYLSPIGQLLNCDDIKILKPRINIHRQLTERLKVEKGMYSRCLQEALAQYANTVTQAEPFHAVSLCNFLDEKLAQVVSSSLEELRSMISAITLDPTLNGEALRGAAKSGAYLANGKSVAPSQITANRLPHATTRDQLTKTEPINNKSIQPDQLTTPAAPHLSVNAGSVTKVGHSISISDQVSDAVTRLCRATYIDAYLRFQTNLPLGFYLEMPEEIIDAVDLPDIESINLHRSSWQILATLSRQFDKDIASLLPASSRWRQITELDDFSEKSFISEYQVYLQGISSQVGTPGTTTDDLMCFFWHPEAGALFAELMRLMQVWRKADPERFHH